MFYTFQALNTLRSLQHIASSCILVFAILYRLCDCEIYCEIYFVCHSCTGVAGIGVISYPWLRCIVHGLSWLSIDNTLIAYGIF